MRSSNAGHVLVSSASGKVPLVRAVMKAARRLDPPAKVIAGDADEGSLARYVADEFWHMPRTEDAQFEALAGGCRTREIACIFPTRDAELPFWARHQVALASLGIDVVVSPTASVELCGDKLAFARFGAEHGLPFIPTAELPDELGSGPYVVKERFGAGGRGIGLQLDRAAALEHARGLQHPVYQPFVAGQEISVDAWLDRAHRVKGLVLRTRDKVVDGESQVTTTFRDEAIEDLALRVLRNLKLRGPVVLQMLLDAGRAPQVIECNARFGGASTASIAAGLDVFYWSLLESRGATLEDVPFRRFTREVRQVRIREDICIYGDRF